MLMKNLTVCKQVNKLSYAIPEFPSPFIELEMEIELTDLENGLEIWINPTSKCSDDEKLLLRNTKNSLEQEKKYTNLGYWQSFLHEGCRFGILYAYNEYTNIFPDAKNIKVVISFLNWNTGATHDLAAYIAIRLFWQIMNFSSSINVYYNLERKRFIFPNANNFPIGQKTLNDLEKLYGDIKNVDANFFKELQEEHQKDIDNYFMR